MQSSIINKPLLHPRSLFSSIKRSRHPGKIHGYRDYASGEVTEERTGQIFEHDILDGDWDVKSWQTPITNPVEAMDGFWVTDVVGEIPRELCGTYFRNGPGEFESFGVEVVHPFDAQGFIGSLAIKGGRAFFRSRFVKTLDSILEEKAKRRLFRGAFGTAPTEGVHPMFHFKSRNAGNTNIAIHNGRLYPLYEGFSSSEMCPFTLETLYPKITSDFMYDSLSYVRPENQNLNSYLDFKTKEMSAHPHKDYDRNLNILHSYGVKPKLGASGISTKLEFFEFRDNLKIVSKTDVSLDNFCMIHDIGFTENYFVFFNSPCKANVSSILDNKHGLVNCIEWDENGVQEIHLVPRPSAKKKNLRHRVVKIKDRLSFVFHYINAYEDGDKIVIDAIHYPKLMSMKFGSTRGQRYLDRKDIAPVPKPEARRVVCDTTSVTEYKTINSRSVEFPVINPKYYGKPHRFSYVSASLHPDTFLEFQAIGKLDSKTGAMKLWVKDQSYFVGEAAFVPKPNSIDEDDGWVVAFGYDGTNNRTEFVILDAKNIEDGPIATLNLNITLPHGLHGTWTHDFYGP
eukprot:g5131.t1